MAREFFNAYHSYLKSVEPLNDAERGRLFTALLIYSSTGVVPELRGNERFVFPTFQEQIDRDAKKYEEKCEKNKKNGALSKANATERKQTPPKCPPNAPQGKGEGKGKGKGEDKGKGENEESFCPEPNNGSTPPAYTLPLNTGEEYPISDELVGEWNGLYPAVDIMQELRSMRGWLMSNPSKRKTKNGILRFINNWLSREQDKGGVRNTKGQKAESGNVFLEMLEGAT